jgi:hypothetical protein
VEARHDTENASVASQAHQQSTLAPGGRVRIAEARLERTGVEVGQATAVLREMGRYRGKCMRSGMQRRRGVGRE